MFLLASYNQYYVAPYENNTVEDGHNDRRQLLVDDDGDSYRLLEQISPHDGILSKYVPAHLVKCKRGYGQSEPFSYKF